MGNVRLSFSKWGYGWHYYCDPLVGMAWVSLEVPGGGGGKKSYIGLVASPGKVRTYLYLWALFGKSNFFLTLFFQNFGREGGREGWVD